MCLPGSEEAAGFSSSLNCGIDLLSAAAFNRCWSAAKKGRAGLVSVTEAAQVFGNIDGFTLFSGLHAGIDFGRRAGVLHAAAS